MFRISSRILQLKGYCEPDGNTQEVLPQVLYKNWHVTGPNTASVLGCEICNRIVINKSPIIKCGSFTEIRRRTFRRRCIRGRGRYCRQITLVTTEQNKNTICYEFRHVTTAEELTVEEVRGFSDIKRQLGMQF